MTLDDPIAVLGLGLIGGSFAAAARAAGVKVIGYDHVAATAARALELGLVDRTAPSVPAAVTPARLVVVATPVGQTRALLAELASALAPDAVVTDVGSTKANVMAAAAEVLGPALERFVPGHPMAGRERHGPDAAEASLFRGRRVLLTPGPATSAAALARVRAAWLAMGATVTELDADTHDRVLAGVSHLPHVLAYTLVDELAAAPDASLSFALAAGGFRDFTRIAASSPEMWRDVALANREALLAALDRFAAHLATVRGALADGDGDALYRLFDRAAQKRAQWSES